MIETAVADVMTRSPRTIEERASVEEAARVLTNHDIGSLVVTGSSDTGGEDAGDGTEKAPRTGQDGIEIDSVVGIVTESDIVRLVAEGMAPDTTVSRVMSTPVVTIDRSSSVETAAGRMKAKGVKKLPVVESGRLIGIVTTTDMAHYIPRYRLDVGRRK